MTIQPPRTRLQPGDAAPALSVPTLTGDLLRIPAGRPLHLQFRRFAGCPVCSLHVRQFAQQQGALENAGVTTVAFFHSPQESLQTYQSDLPFAVVPDPERRVYRLYGVEQSWSAMLHPRTMLEGMRGLLGAPSNPMAADGGRNGLPADFLIAADGRVLACKYGRQADDHWSVQHVLRLAGHHAPLPGLRGAVPA